MIIVVCYTASYAGSAVTAPYGQFVMLPVIVTVLPSAT